MNISSLPSAYLLGVECPLVSTAAGSSVEVRKEFRVSDMDFPGVDANNGAITFMHIDDLVGVLSSEDKVVVELIVLSQSGQLGTWDMGQRAEP